jgi:hypothetical protein
MEWMRRTSALLVLLFAGSSHAVAATWYEVKFEHARLLSNVSAHQTERIARSIVLFDAGIAAALPQLNRTPTTRVTLLLLDGNAWERISDTKYGTNLEYDGCASTVLLRERSFGEADGSIHYQLAELLLRDNFPQPTLPLWRAKGFPIVIGSVGIERDRIIVGSARNLRGVARDLVWLPMREFLERPSWAVEKLAPATSRNFWIQSVARNHYAAFADTLSANQLRTYLNRLAEGEDFPAAIAKSFPDDVTQLDRDVRDYVTAHAYKAFTTPVPPAVSDYSPVLARISETDAAEVIGEWIAHRPRPSDSQLAYLDTWRAQRDAPPVMDLLAHFARLRREDLSQATLAAAACDTPQRSAHAATLCGDITLHAARLGSPTATIAAANTHYLHAVEMDPDHFEAMCNGSGIPQQDPRVAAMLIAGLERWNARNDRNPTVSFALARLYADTDRDRALRHLDRAALYGFRKTDVDELRRRLEQQQLSSGKAVVANNRLVQ